MSHLLLASIDFSTFHSFYSVFAAFFGAHPTIASGVGTSG